jgi:hypothetical protein
MAVTNAPAGRIGHGGIKQAATSADDVTGTAPAMFDGGHA